MDSDRIETPLQAVVEFGRAIADSDFRKRNPLAKLIKLLRFSPGIKHPPGDAPLRFRGCRAEPIIAAVGIGAVADQRFNGSVIVVFNRFVDEAGHVGFRLDAEPQHGSEKAIILLNAELIRLNWL